MPQGTCDADGRPAAGHNTYHQGQGEFLDGSHAEDVERQDHEECGQGSKDTSGKCLADTRVDYFFKGCTRLSYSQILTYTVKYNDRSVDGVTDDSQHACYECAADTDSDDGISCQHYQAVMRKADNRGSAEAGILESEPDISQHQDKRHDDCVESGRLHLGTDRGADRLRSDIVLVDLELILQSDRKRRALLLVEFLGLKDHFAAARDLLHLRIGVTGGLCDDRDHLLVDLIEGHVLVECDISGSAAHEIKAVVQGALAAAGVHGHSGQSRDDHDTGDREDNLSLADKVDKLDFSSLSIELFICCAEGVSDVHEKSCHEESREHGYDDTDRQCIRKALDRAGSQDRENCCRDQSCDVSVDDRGESFIKAALNCHLNVLACAQFFANTRENDNVRVNCHTDGEQDTCDTGQSQGDIKRVDDDRNDQNIDAERNTCAHAGQPVDHAHEECYQREAQYTCCLTGSDRVLSELGAYDLGTQSLQFDLKSADTDIGGKALRLFDRTLAGDDRTAVCDRRLNSGNANKFAVVVDTDALAGRIGLGRRISKLLLAFVSKCKGNHDFLIVHIVGLIAGFGFRHVRALQNSVAVRDDLLEILGQDIAVIAVLVSSEFIVLVSALICLSDKIQRAGLAQFLEDLVGLFDAGDAGDLDIDPVAALRVDLRLCAVLVNTLLKLVNGVRHILCRGVFVAYCLISDAGAACKVESKLDVVIRSSVPAAQTYQCGIRHKSGDHRG